MQQGLACTGRLLDGDVLDKQPQHPLAVLGLCGGGVPKAREVLRQGQHLGLLLGGERPRFPSFGFGMLLFDLRELLHGFVPPALKGCSDQPVGGVDLLVTPFGELGFVLGAFDAHLPLPRYRLVACFEVVQGLQGKFEFRWLQ